MDSYLIRIYRRDKQNPEAIVGIVEEIGSKKTQSFKTLSELTGIITLPQGKGVKGGKHNETRKG